MKKLFRFRDYDHYVEVQTACNKAKLAAVWVGHEECRAIAKTIRRLTSSPKFGLCHGVRNGYEVRYLRAALAAEVVGTEISDTAERFDGVVRRDFHDAVPEWQGRADFIYSNSLDHSYDPELAISRWAASLNARGICILHWSSGHDYPEFANDGADCFAGTRADYEELLAPHFSVVEVVPLEPRGEGHEAEQSLVVGAQKRNP